MGVWCMVTTDTALITKYQKITSSSFKSARKVMRDMSQDELADFCKYCEDMINQLEKQADLYLDPKNIRESAQFNVLMSRIKKMQVYSAMAVEELMYKIAGVRFDMYATADSDSE